MREWLKGMRTAAGLSYKEMAAKIGVAESYYFRIEHGQRALSGMRTDMLVKLADSLNANPMEVLRMEMDYLLSEAKEGKA